jgi:IS30 family transposase
MRISHEAIYQSLYVQGRGALRRELTACMRTGRALRVARADAWPRQELRDRGGTRSVSGPPRPRTGPFRGHWEGDLIIGLDSSSIGTLVERNKSLHDAAAPAGDGRPRVSAGHTEPALTGHGAEAVHDAIASAITTLSAQL